MKIFISHSSHDKPFARKLRRDLTSLGYDVWMDEKEIPIGGSIPSSIQDGLQQSDYVILVISPDALESGWVGAEWEAVYSQQATERRIRLLPVVRNEAELPPFLAGHLHANARKNYATALAKIIQTIEKKSSGPVRIFRNNEDFCRAFPIADILSRGGQDVVFCGFAHSGSLFRRDDDQIAAWVRKSRRFEIFLARPEHSEEKERLPRIKYYKKKFSYNQLDGVIERCWNVRQRLSKRDQTKFSVRLVDLPRINLLDIKRMGGHFFVRFIGFAQMGEVSPVLAIPHSSESADFFSTYINNLRRFDEFWTPLFG